MKDSLFRIHSFIQEHHVMSLATFYEDEISSCSLFYVYDESSQSFVVASSMETTHILHINNNPKIAGNILLETKEIGNIQGVQFKGIFLELRDEKFKKEYFKRFPYAKALSPKLWKIEVNSFKMTDNRLGFAKKIIWP
ncbi:hypothetical protein GJV85_10085 [Sulfurimonas aquatica]|uniref:Pyridoxamine 5'-phosphate oxidase putative domain-containing protein n=1 Tax=Sulfurimonas aquatica TaxID=2672570 RepID=A0A975GDC4_9BACT|nr:pyridoxamine 5'-phosphate oxidase family protein [Sulfurimonas aquatica]QSZ42442.1 hypothetical protein GJV85_10085 [Sulfurimonas aquatica]